MKVNYKKIEEYLENALNVERMKETEMPLETVKQKYECFKSIFWAEYGWIFERNKNGYEILSEYLQGLPSSIDIAFNYYDIINLAIEWNSLPKEHTEKQSDKICDNYWSFITNQLVKFARKNGVDLLSK